MGDNKYDAEGFGLQEAKKGCRFSSLPQVLQVHLKRFEYDPVKDDNIKINDKYTFSSTLDLSRYVSSDSKEPPIYSLFGYSQCKLELLNLLMSHICVGY